MGKLTGIIANEKNVEKTVHKSEWISQITMLVLVILAVITLPLISDVVVISYIQDSFSVFGQYMLYALYSYGFFNSPVGTDGLYVCIISLVIIALVLFVGVGKKNKQKQANIYLAGASLDDAKRIYKGSMSKKTEATSRNMYLDAIFGEKSLAPFGSILNIILFALAGIASIILMLGVIPGLA